MGFEELVRDIKERIPSMSVKQGEKMKAHCSFHIGGPADVFAEPASETELAALCRLLAEKNIKPQIIGNGSNILVPDEGIRGVVIKLGEGFGEIRREHSELFCGSGVTLSHAALFAQRSGLSGLEFAYGIPGSVGGAVYMNAGAYGGEMKDVVTSVRYLDIYGNICESSQNGFSYRHSRFTDGDDIILGARLRLTEGEPEKILESMKTLLDKRSASQPLDRPSAGSTFKRPENGYAAAMIDEAGLKGFAVGGAQVSEKHAGFVVNTGDATFEDVIAVIDHVRKTVFEKNGVALEPEVKIIR